MRTTETSRTRLRPKRAASAPARDDAAHQQKALREAHQLAGGAQVDGQPMAEVAVGVGATTRRRGEAARLRRQLHEGHRRQSADHRDGEDTDSQSGDLGDRA